ncbi:MAG: hypothetical protein RR840_03390 [Clostridium sp.]
MSVNLTNSPDNLGFIRVRDLGYFDAYFTVDFVYFGGFYQYVSPELGMYDTATITIPKDAEYVRFRAYIAIFIKAWSLVCDHSFNVVPSKCYNLTGTTISPSCFPVECPNQITLPNETDLTDITLTPNLIFNISSLDELVEKLPY